MRFWDTSALVPLLVTQGTSPQTDEWLVEDGDIAVWTLTAIELTSALMRLAREGAIRERDAATVDKREPSCFCLHWELWPHGQHRGGLDGDG